MRYSKQIRICIFISSLLWPVSGFSQTNFYSGNDLYRYCSAGIGVAIENLCNAYIVGAVDVMMATGYVCLPKDFIAKQVVDIVINYLRAHPEKRHYTAASEISAALRDFDCKNSK